MKDENKKVPRLRFPGFTGDWEQRKLGDICSKIGSGKTPLGGRNSYCDSGVPLIRSQNVNNDRVDLSDVVFINETIDESMSNSRVYKDDVLLNITGASIGRSAVYKGNVHANVNQHVCIIRPHKGYMPDFIQLHLTSENGQKQVELNQAGGGREGLNFQQIGNMYFSFPSIDEQQEIAGFLMQLDKAITLHQRKLDQIKEYKKGMLQKMFPKKGETVPEVRFPGFEGDWEEKKLGQLFSFVKTKNTNGLIDNVITNSAEYGLIPQREYFDKDIAVEGHTENYTIIEKGNFVYNPRKSTSAPYGPFNCYKLDEKGVVSPLYTCLDLEDSEYAEYLIWYFKTDKWHPYIQSNGAQGGARHDRVGMTNDLMKGIPILLPSVPEQKQIGEFFENLDFIITFHQYKI